MLCGCVDDKDAPQPQTAPVTTEGTMTPVPSAAVAGLETVTPPPPGQDVGALDYQQTPTADPLFRAGTLIYTSGGIVLLFFWLLWGDFALSMRDRSVQPMVQLFLNSRNASSLVMTTLVTAVPAAIGLVLIPWISYKSDRHRSRWGRRIPFLLIPTPIAALAMIGIAYSPRVGSLLRVFAPSLSSDGATLIVFGMLWTIFEIAIITSNPVMAGLVNDVVPRGRLGRFYGLFRQVSLLDGMLFSYFLLKFAESHFTLMFALIGIVFGSGFVLMCLNVKEGQYPPPPPVSDDPGSRGFFGAIRIYFKECFSQPYYRWCIAAITLGQVTFVPFNSFSVYYAKNLNVDIDVYGKLTAYSYFASLCLAYFLGWLVDRYHALRIALAAMALYALSTAYGFVFTRNPQTFAIAFVAHVVLSGTYFTAAMSLPAVLLPRNRFAQFASASFLLISLSTMVLSPTLGFIIDHTNENFRLTFLAGLLLCITTILVMLVVYQRMQEYGGTKNYVAPGDTAG